MALIRKNTSGVSHLNQFEYKKPWPKLNVCFIKKTDFKLHNT